MISTSDLGYPTITQGCEIEVITMTCWIAWIKLLQSLIEKLKAEAEDGRGLSLSSRTVPYRTAVQHIRTLSDLGPRYSDT